MRRAESPVTLWHAAFAEELTAIAASGWTWWPDGSAVASKLRVFRDRARAVQHLSALMAAGLDDGYLLGFDVAVDVSVWPDTATDEGAWLVAHGRRLRKAMIGTIRDEAHYRRGASQQDVDAVRDAFGELVPDAWRDLVSQASYPYRVRTSSGPIVELHDPPAAIAVTREWTDELVYHPGVLIIGSAGRREHLAIDLRDDDPAVVLLDPASTGWDNATIQAATVTDFADRLERGQLDISR